MRKIEIIILGIVLFSFIAGIYFYPKMPEQMAIHWNAQGEVDGYISKFWGLFLFPFILTGLYLLFLLIPRIDPLKTNIEKFIKYYYGLFILILIFILSIYLYVILWNVGIKINPNIIFSVECGLLFFYIGILCKKAKRNWFVGIRTPWTLSSEMVWDKTHKIGGKLFKIAGIIAFIGAIFPRYALFFILVPLILTAIYTILYSYFEYQKETK